MAPKFVIPYRLSGKAGKNDAADAAAICEAVTRPSMRFVPPKSLEQQAPHWRTGFHWRGDQLFKQKESDINRTTVAVDLAARFTMRRNSTAC